MEQQNQHNEDEEGGPPPEAEVVEKSPRERYLRFKHLLGQGAYKQVWQAYDTIEGIEVAWNVVNLKKMPPAEKARVINEVRLLDRLEHNNIIDFHGSWVNREKGEVVFVTEILSSGSLKKFITKVQVIRWKIIKRWCKQILRALAYLHSQNPPIIHRDIKCDNIFINGTTGDLRIGDLGLSTTATIERNGKGQSVLGTPEFMAPELYDEEYDEMVDIYAFGMCALEMITKQLPYAECTNPTQIYRKVTANIQPKALELVPEGDALDFVLCCVAMDPKERWSAKELLEHPFLEANPVLDETEVRIRQAPRMQQIAENSLATPPLEPTEAPVPAPRQTPPPISQPTATTTVAGDSSAVNTSSSSARKQQQQPTVAAATENQQQVLTEKNQQQAPAETARTPQQLPPQKQRRFRIKETTRLAVMAATEAYVASSQAATGALDAAARAMSSARKNGFEEEEEDDDDEDSVDEDVGSEPLKTPTTNNEDAAEESNKSEAPSTVFYTPKTARDSEASPLDAGDATPIASSENHELPSGGGAEKDHHQSNGVPSVAAVKSGYSKSHSNGDMDARAEATAPPVPPDGVRNGHEAARKAPAPAADIDARQSDDRRMPQGESLGSVDENAEFEDAQTKQENEEYFKNMGDFETLEKSKKVRILEGREKRRADDDDKAILNRAPAPAVAAPSQAQEEQQAPRARRPSQTSVTSLESAVADRHTLSNGNGSHHASSRPSHSTDAARAPSPGKSAAPAPAAAARSPVPAAPSLTPAAAPPSASPRRVPSPGIKSIKQPSPQTRRKEFVAKVADRLNNGHALVTQQDLPAQQNGSQPRRPASIQGLSRSSSRRGEFDDGSSTTSSRSRGHSPPPSTPETHRLANGRARPALLSRSKSADPGYERVNGHHHLHSTTGVDDIPHAVALPHPSSSLAPAPPPGNHSPTSSVVSDGASTKMHPVVVNDAHLVDPPHLQHNTKLLAMYDDETASQSSQIIDRPIDDNVVSLSFPYSFDGVTRRVSFEYDLREEPTAIAAEFAVEMGYPPEEMQPFADLLASVKSRHRKRNPPPARSSFGSSIGPVVMESSDSLLLTEKTTPDDSDEDYSEDAATISIPPASVAYLAASDDLLLVDDDDEEDEDELQRRLKEEYKVMKMRFQSIHEDRMDKLQHSREDCVLSHEQASAKYEQDMRDLGRREREISTSKEEAVSVHERNVKKYEKDMHDYEQKFMIEHKTYSKRLQEFDDDYRQKQDEVRRRARAKLSSAPSSSRDQHLPNHHSSTYRNGSIQHNNSRQAGSSASSSVR